MKMRYANLLCTVVSAALILAGCVDYGMGGKSEYQAPLLSGKDDAANKVDIKGNLRFGKSLQDKFSDSKPLTGFLLSANAGARLTVTLTGGAGQDPVLLLYGPRSDKGIFGSAIAKDDDGKDGRNALLKNFALPSGGVYLVAAADYQGKGGGDLDVSVGCQGNCQEPSCPDILCDLYCPTGFMTDPNGCPICRCNEAECQTDADCYNMYPWANGQPVCIDGRCVWNDLYCDQNVACPTGYYCEMGPCPEMPCGPDGNCPPCPGKCVPNQTYCNGDFDCPAGQMCVNGLCLPWAIECQDNSQCPPGMECLISCPAGPACNDPADPNCKPCDPNVDPWCGQCIGQCVPVQPPSCDESTPCPAGYICIMDCWSCDAATGQCPPCDPNTDPNCGTTMCKGYCQPMNGECQTNEDCRYPDGQIGFCINGKCVNQQIPCDENGACPPGMMCMGTCSGCDPATGQCPPDPVCEAYCVPVDPPRCYSDFDCRNSAGQMGRCLNGQCVFGQLQCSSDWQCPPNYRCDLLQCVPGCDPSMMPDCCYGVCVPNGQPYCRDDSQCIQNGVAGRCINGQCVFDGCGCPDVWDPVCATVCDASGMCFERTFPNACYARCNNARVEYAGECGQNRTCTDDAACGPGYYCEFCLGANGDPAGPCSDVGVCLPLPDMVCQSNQDCPQGYECIFDRCPEMPCGPDGNCPPCLGRCVPGQTACVQTGCNGEVCAPFPVSTSCIWLPEYACLGYTTCEQLMSSDGRVTCGFVQTQEYLRCLQDIQNPSQCASDRDCPPGQVCQTFCDAAGVCRTGCYASDCVCPEYYDPVCGRDGQTYDNICYLSCANMEMAYPGPCR